MIEEMIDDGGEAAGGGKGEGGGRGCAGAVVRQGPLIGQIYIHLANAGMYLLTRLLLIEGMSHYVFVTYRQALATLAIAPFALYFERDQISKLTLKNMGHMFLLALLGITISQNFTFAGLSLTTTTLATTLHNLNPAITFIMAVCFGLERMDVWTKRGQAKVVGTILCVAGAMVVTLVKGPPLYNMMPVNHEQPLHQILPTPDLGVSATPASTWIIGSLLLAVGSWSWCAFIIYQVRIVEESPSELMGATVICGLGTIQSLVVALFIEKPESWRLGWDLQLLNIVISGILCTAFGFFVQMWCMKEKGPLFSTIFNPMSTVLTAILEPIILPVQLYWGSVVGMVMVFVGLYSVLWGKANEVMVRKGNKGSEKSIVDKTNDDMKKPLLTGGGKEDKMEDV